MISKQEFLAKITRQKIVPLIETLVFDAETPVAVLSRLKASQQFVFLEGISQSLKKDRFSYLGLDPYLEVRCVQDRTLLVYSDGRTETSEENVFDLMQKLLSRFAVEKNPAEQFHSGILGYMSYECVNAFEKIPFPEQREIDMPVAHLIIPRTLCVFDNELNAVSVVRNVFQEEVANAPESAFAREQAILAEIVSDLISGRAGAPEPLPVHNFESSDPSQFEFNLSTSEYLAAVNQCKEYIRMGHIFQVQMSRRTKVKLRAKPLALYRNLRTHNPAPFLFHLRLGDIHMLGSSPEILVEMRDDQVTIRPLAGTRKRRSSKKTEQAIMEELLSDEKERAEHIMLVDLARNDLGRACVNGSVRVNELMTIEKYRHVMHIVSDVSGTIKPSFTAVDALKYGFPAGTVTGTPKIRAMEIISELEPVQREFYGGSVLFIDFQNNLKSTLTIRTMLIKGEYIYTQAAAGIVTDSIPEHEFAETANKMRACLDVMQIGEGAR